MADLVADIVAELDRHDRESAERRSAIMDRLRAATRAQPAGAAAEPDGVPLDWIRTSQAVSIFKVSRTYLYTHGIEQLSQPGGFSFRTEDGDFRYSQSRLGEYIRRNPPRRRGGV